MQIGKAIFNHILFGNLFIGICAVSLSLASYVQLNVPVSENYHFIFIFFSTVFIYSIHSLRSEFPGSGTRFYWLKRNQNILKIQLGVVIIGLFLSGRHLNYHSLLILIPMAVVSVLYTIGNFSDFPLNIRKIAFSKPIIVGVVWGVVTVLLPVTEGANFNPVKLGQILTERILFITALCIPFDIRDTVTDKTENLKTFSSEFGIRNAKFIAILILGLSMIISLLNNSVYSVFLTGVSSLFFIRYSDRMEDYFFNLYGDGQLIIYYLSVYIFSNYIPGLQI
jgi:hypothetical protein